MFRFRKARRTDEEILLKWINDPLSRKMSLNTEPISSQEHRFWFLRSLRNRNTNLYIYEEIKTNGTIKPIASLRVDVKYNRKYLSWNVSERMRGKGIGGTMLSDFINRFRGNYYAIIKKDNPASMTICTKSGFNKYYSKENLTYWKNF